MILVLLVSALSLGSVVAQDRLFAVSGQGRGGAGDARQAAQISQLESANTTRNTCEASGLLYSPGHAEADVDGCITPGAGSEGIPTGGVVAFNLDSCPDGWSVLGNAVGRMIVGLGTYTSNADDDGSNPATTYNRGDIGGRMDHVLTKGQMPRHRHSLANGVAHNRQGPGGNWNVGGTARNMPYNGYSNWQGSDQAHENRPPYLALLYCQKD